MWWRTTERQQKFPRSRRVAFPHVETLCRSTPPVQLRPSLTAVGRWSTFCQVHTIIEDRDFTDTDLDGFLEHSYQVTLPVSLWCTSRACCRSTMPPTTPPVIIDPPLFAF